MENRKSIYFYLEENEIANYFDKKVGSADPEIKRFYHYKTALYIPKKNHHYAYGDIDFYAINASLERLFSAYKSRGYVTGYRFHIQTAFDPDLWYNNRPCLGEEQSYFDKAVVLHNLLNNDSLDETTTVVTNMGDFVSNYVYVVIEVEYEVYNPHKLVDNLVK